MYLQENGKEKLLEFSFDMNKYFLFIEVLCDFFMVFFSFQGFETQITFLMQNLRVLSNTFLLYYITDSKIPS